MKRYPEYKDSGVEGIGKIPLEWDIKKLKYLIDGKLTYGANEAAEEINTENPRYIRITDFGNDGRLRDETFKSLPFDLAKEYLLKEGDVLFARSGATVGKTFQFKNYNGIACFAGYLIKATPHNNKLDSDYLYFFTKSGVYENWKDSIFIQATIQNIGADKYSYLPLPLPPIHIQRTISIFLSHKTCQIDELIAKKQKLIELLKEERTALINHAVTKGLDTTVPMKVLGIEWLGEIPEHWELYRLKSLGSIRYGLGQPPKSMENGLPLIRATNIQKGKIVNIDMVFVNPDELPLAKNPILKKGEIIVVRSGAYTGDSAIITEEYAGSVAGYDMVFTSIKCCPDFISYSFLSHYVLDNQLIPSSCRAAQPHLNAEELGSTLIACPPYEEQVRISNYLQNQTAWLEATILKLQTEIDLFSEYKTSLINEVVTGKIKISDAN